MVRFRRGLMAVLAMLGCLAAGAQAEEAIRMEVYIAEEAMDVEMADGLIRLLDEAIPQAEWALAEGEGDLRQRVMDDCAPDLAICAPGGAMPWAKEGMLLPLDGRISGASRIQREALEPGVWAERLYMAPLFARHRQLAVNADRIMKLQMRHLTDGAAYPVWLPSQLEQVLEELYLADETGMEVWPPIQGEGEAVFAFAQALYGGAWINREGEVRAGDPAAILGVGWLGEMVKSGVIGYSENRAAALENFLAGRTAIFIDWTEKEERLLESLENGAPFALEVMPYPAADGVPVRSFELTGMCAFDTGEAERNALLVKAIAFLHESGAARALPGSRAIWQDDAVWLRTWDTDACGATLMQLAGEAMTAVLGGEADAQEAFSGVQAAMNAAGFH